MANKNDTTFFENKLLDFVTAKDPMLEMLQWVMDKFMKIEVAHKIGAEKGIHAESRTGYRCGYRIRCFDTRLKLIQEAPDEKSARAMKDDFCEEYEKSLPKAVECLEEGFEDSVQFYAFEELDSRLRGAK